MRETTTFAVLAALLMVGWAAAPVAGATADTTLSVSVGESEDGYTATVTESTTENNTTTTTGAAGARVDVTVLDENASYEGAGSYDADENGTVDLPAPSETVNVSVEATSGNLTANTTATLSPVEGNETDDNESDAFGQEVSAFVAQLQNDSNVTRIGPLVASFVVANNPGNAPDHAGPPEWLVNDSVNRSQGPPDHAGPPEDGNESDAGPPEDRGGDGDDADDEGADAEGDDADDESANGNGNGNGNDGGPPEDRGGDDADDESANGNGNGNGNDNGGGPPEDRGGDGDDEDDEDDDDEEDDDESLVVRPPN